MRSQLETVPAAATGRGPKIAIACSGLGHISRGVETWAADIAQALHRRGADVTLFQGGGEASAPWQRIIPCIQRFTPEAERLRKRFSRSGGWRFGVGNGYQIEQTTFGWNLWPHIRRDFDIVHTQDSLIGLMLERLNRLGLSRPRVILAHGTEEPVWMLNKYAYLQHLAPCYLDDYEPSRPSRQATFAIGNFVNVDVFRPGDSAAARAEWGLPLDHLIVLCVAAIKKHHKRIDYMLREFATFLSASDRPATLVIAGGVEADTPELIALGRELLGDRVVFLQGVPRSKIPALYRTADVFALASLTEMMPIAVLEAIATGLPVLCSDTPTFRWMAGPAGLLADLSAEGAMAEQLKRIASGAVRKPLACAARAHAEACFSEPVIMQQILEMYAEVAGGSASSAFSRDRVNPTDPSNPSDLPDAPAPPDHAQPPNHAAGAAPK